MRRLEKKRSLERQQWAQYDRYRKDMQLVGRGEGYLEEVYFGRGFSLPPTFSYSSVFSQKETVIMPYMQVPPEGSLNRLVDEYGLGNDQQTVTAMIQDPGFEYQGKHRSLSVNSGWDKIPDARESAIMYSSDDYWGDAGYGMPIAEFLNNANEAEDYVNTWSPKYGDTQHDVDSEFAGHRWVQSGDTRNVWSVTDTEHHDMGVGERGEVCATAVIGPNGYTNWLVPFDYSGAFDYANVHPEYAYLSWRTQTESLSGTSVSYSFGNGPWRPSYPPPYIEGNYGFAHVKCDSDVELQVKATFASDYVYESVLRGEKVWQAKWDSYFVDGDEGGEEWDYRRFAEIEDNHNVTAGDWSRVDISLPYQGWHGWPQTPRCLDSLNEASDTTYWNIAFRVKGTPGDSVYLDNIHMAREMRNAEVPMLTIGVDEWIRDEAGVYIGARLWVTYGTPTGTLCGPRDGREPGQI